MRDRQPLAAKRAKELRRSMTDAEVILWSRLREYPIHRFRRQHPVGPYIADFACMSARLIVEVDGETHASAADIERDRNRDTFLRTKRWRVLRIWNEDVYKNLPGVLDAIDVWLADGSLGR